MRDNTALLLAWAALSSAAANPAWASCAEDLTRIQVAMPKAAPDLQSRLGGLVQQAEAKAKARDAKGCEDITRQALAALNLPVLPPLQLSTPMAGPQEQAQAGKPSEPAASPTRASPDPRSSGPGGATSAQARPTPTAPPGVVGANQPEPSATANSGGAQPQAVAAPPAPASGSPPPGQPASGQPTGGRAAAGQATGQGSGQAGGQGPAAGQGGQQEARLPAGAPARPGVGGAAGGPPESPGAQQGAGGTSSFLSTRDLVGSEVRDRENYGHTLGRVSSVILDRTSGRALYVVLSSGGFLGWDRNRVLVPYNLLSFTGQWDNPTLNVAASKIENAPRVTEGDLGTLLHDPDWRRAVSDYFGIALADNAGSAGGGERPPSGPREAPPSGPAAQNAPPSGPHVPSNPTGPTSDPKASPGEGATGPTAAGGAPGAAQTSTAMAMPTAGAASGGGADPHHGQTVAQHVCAACHTLNQGGTTRVGPNLFGIGERGIASLPGYNYSAALKGHQGNWEPQQLDAFLKSPRGYAPGTYMTFPGISSDRDRRDVVAYLESLK